MNGRLLVIGQGYVGLPLALRASETGYSVVGFDIDAERISHLAAGRSHVEDVSDERLRRSLAHGYRPTDDPSLEPFDVAVITVPTPLTDGIPDLTAVRSAAQLAGRHLSRGSTVVLESTSFPGTTTQIVQPILEQLSGLSAGRDFHLGYSPERIDPGNPQWHFENTPKVVSGIDAASAKMVAAFYEDLVDTTVEVSTTEVAELTKLLENTFRHVNIALVNELAMVAHDLGINVWEAIDAAATKPFGFMSFRPGPGVGGHCLPVDPTYLGWQVKQQLGVNFRFVELANDINDHMPDYVVRRVQAGLNRRGKPVFGSEVLLLGLAFKPNTSDARESPVTRVVRGLGLLGARITLADPHVEPSQFPGGTMPLHDTGPDLITAAAHAEAIVLLVDHDAFPYDEIHAAAPEAFLLDCRGTWTDSGAERL